MESRIRPRTRRKGISAYRVFWICGFVGLLVDFFDMAAFLTGGRFTFSIFGLDYAVAVGIGIGIFGYHTLVRGLRGTWDDLVLGVINDEVE